MILTVIRRLNRELFQPELAVVRPGGALSRNIPRDIPVHHVAVRRVRYAFPSIVRLCWSRRPDVVLTTLGHLNLCLLLLRPFLPAGTALAVREANTPSLNLAGTGQPRIFSTLYRGLYPRADAVVCNCVAMQADLWNHFGVPGERTVVLYNPVDEEEIVPQSRQGANPFRGTGIHLLSVGRLTHQKGMDRLLEAFALVSKRFSGCDLTIVGDGPQREFLEKKAKELGIPDSVHFVGYRANPFVYMRHAHLFVSTSRWEGLPNTVLESLACGTPVVAFDCPGGTGEIIRDGLNGWLVPDGNCAALVGKISEVITDRQWAALDGGSLLPGFLSPADVVHAYEALLCTLGKRRSSR